MKMMNFKMKTYFYKWGVLLYIIAFTIIKICIRIFWEIVLTKYFHIFIKKMEWDFEINLLQPVKP